MPDNIPVAVVILHIMPCRTHFGTYAPGWLGDRFNDLGTFQQTVHFHVAGTDFRLAASLQVDPVDGGFSGHAALFPRGKVKVVAIIAYLLPSMPLAPFFIKEVVVFPDLYKASRFFAPLI